MTCTVQELIEKLKTFPSDFPIFIRPKYSGGTLYAEDWNIKIHSISEMHPENAPKNVTILV